MMIQQYHQLPNKVYGYHQVANCLTDSGIDESLIKVMLAETQNPFVCEFRKSNVILKQASFSSSKIYYPNILLTIKMVT